MGMTSDIERDAGASPESRAGGAVQPFAQRPLFIVGAVRSGTTLLRLMLDGHPRIAMHPEFEFAVDLVGTSGERPAMDAYREHLRLDRVFKHFGWRVDPSLTYDEQVADFLEQCRERSSRGAVSDGAGSEGLKPLIGATVHHRFDVLRHIWPGARYVHIVRDPRAVADSVIQMGWAGTHWHGCERWIRAESAWNQLVPHLDENQWIGVTYEELLREPERVLDRVCGLVGEAYDPAMMAYPGRSTYGPTDAKNAERWREKLTPEQMALVEARLGDMMDGAGYGREQPAVRLGPIKMAWLHLRDKAYRARFAMKRYGMGLYLRERATRWLGMKAAHERALERVHEVDEANLK